MIPFFLTSFFPRIDPKVRGAHKLICPFIYLQCRIPIKPFLALLSRSSKQRNGPQVGRTRSAGCYYDKCRQPFEIISLSCPTRLSDEDFSVWHSFHFQPQLHLSTPADHVSAYSTYKELRNIFASCTYFVF